MKKVKKVFAALLLLFVANTLMAQSETYTLKGNLKDANDGAMMPYTNCVLLHSADNVFAYGVTSDDKGAFFFKGIEGGFYLLRISCVGYETHWQPVDIHAEKSIGTIKLSPISTSLNEIQITASRPIYSADGEKTLYNVDDDPSVQTGSASDALQNAPGVEVNAEGKISFRGGCWWSTSRIGAWIAVWPPTCSTVACRFTSTPTTSSRVAPRAREASIPIIHRPTTTVSIRAISASASLGA